MSDPARDKRRFQLYFAVKLLAAVLLVGAALLLREGWSWFAAPLLLMGVAGLFVRPRHLFRDRR